MGNKFLLLNIHKITLLFHLLDSNIVGLEVLIVSIEILHYMMKTAGQYIRWAAHTNQCYMIQ